ncbi:MAG: M23 family metallopeptidase [Firmicutes bacterium]|nr:M23 family metallopeptidase [Bacillota bacterium]
MKEVEKFLIADLSFILNTGTSVPPGWRPEESGIWKWPLPGSYTITSGFGSRVDPVEGRNAFHHGLDISAAMGAPVLAARDGEVIFAGKKGNYGNVIFVDHGRGIQTRYAHLSRIAVEPGQQVNAGGVIGYAGNTGKSTGPHLHLEIRVNGRVRNPVNFYGGVD